MVLVIIGIAITGFALHHWRRSAIPAAARRVSGIVTDVSVKRTSLTGSSHLLYGPTVEYLHPETARPTLLPPDGHIQTEYHVGDRVEVAVDPGSGRALLVMSRPLLQRIAPVLFGLGVVGLGIADLTI